MLRGEDGCYSQPHMKAVIGLREERTEEEPCQTALQIKEF